MSTPAAHHDIGEAILKAQAGKNGWATANGCPMGCECAVCWEINAGLERLNTALKEMKAVEE